MQGTAYWETDARSGEEKSTDASRGRGRMVQLLSVFSLLIRYAKFSLEKRIVGE
jgi:hypothetical protein